MVTVATTMTSDESGEDASDPENVDDDQEDDGVISEVLSENRDASTTTSFSLVGFERGFTTGASEKDVSRDVLDEDARSSVEPSPSHTSTLGPAPKRCEPEGRKSQKRQAEARRQNAKKNYDDRNTSSEITRGSDFR